MDRAQFVTFVREGGLAVVATHGHDGIPEAALVDVAASDRAEIIFDTSARSRKYRNIQTSPHVALVIGWDDEVTVQCEGTADILRGADRDRCLQIYCDQYPDGRQRAEDPDIAHIRVRPAWIRHSDYRADSFAIRETQLDD